MLLRDPTERAFSHWLHRHRGGLEPRPFEAALDMESAWLPAELERLSTYAEQLERWFAQFPRERFLILRSEDLFADPAPGFAEIVRFLGLRDWQPRRFPNERTVGRSAEYWQRTATLAPETEARLRADFAPHNRRLAAAARSRLRLGPGLARGRTIKTCSTSAPQN